MVWIESCIGKMKILILGGGAFVLNLLIYFPLSSRLLCLPEMITVDSEASVATVYHKIFQISMSLEKNQRSRSKRLLLFCRMFILGKLYSHLSFNTA